MNLNIQTKYDLVTADGEETQKTFADILSANQKTLLYFYPKDNTPGCTIENKDFSAFKKEFEAKGINLVGVSKDSIESHKKFITKQELGNDLISDPELILHNELGTYGEKKNYGKIYNGVIRSTFLIGKNGELLNEWRNIRAKGHAERILKEV